MNIPVVYEDDWLLAVDKPAGLLVIPTPKKETRTLTSILNIEAKDKGADWRLHPCHRLDRETSGVILYAKGKSIQKKMMDEFKAGRVKKTYTAFVQGSLPKDKGLLQDPIDGLSSATEYELIERRKDFSIVRIRPLTGRKNQIRIQFKNIGHPLVGESRFAFRRDFELRAKRTCLHASVLEFTHPVTKKSMRIPSELAADLKKFLEKHPD